MDASKLTPGQRAYEEKRARKAGQSLDAWLRGKEKRAREEAAEAVKSARAAEPEAPRKPNLLQRLLERAQKPL